MRGRAGLTPGFSLVFWRELRWLRRRPFLLLLTTLLPLALMALLTGIFSQGLATRLPIGVLDLDDSDLSRAIVRTVDATPDAAVKTHVGELAEERVAGDAVAGQHPTGRAALGFGDHGHQQVLDGDVLVGEPPGLLLGLVEERGQPRRDHDLALRGVEVGAALLITAFGLLLLSGYMVNERMIGF